MNAPSTLITSVVATEEELCASSRCDPQYPLAPAASEGLQGVEEQLRARIAGRLRGRPAAYLPNTDKDSGQDKPTHVSGRRRGKGVRETENC